MRTHEHREGSITLWGVLGENKGGTGGDREVGEGGITWEKCHIKVMRRKSANNIDVCVPMQQSCMFFTCTLKPEMQ